MDIHHINCSSLDWHMCVQVMGGVSGGGHHTAAEGHIMFIGNLCLLINTLASAVYYLGAKKLVQVSILISIFGRSRIESNPVVT